MQKYEHKELSDYESIAKLKKKQIEDLKKLEEEKEKEKMNKEKMNLELITNKTVDIIVNNVMKKFDEWVFDENKLELSFEYDINNFTHTENQLELACEKIRSKIGTSYKVIWGFRFLSRQIDIYYIIISML